MRCAISCGCCRDARTAVSSELDEMDDYLELKIDSISFKCRRHECEYSLIPRMGIHIEMLSSENQLKKFIHI